MLAILNVFPLSGSTVSSVLRTASLPGQLWTISDIETLAEPPARSLGDLWKKVQDSPIEMNTADLCGVLDHATQIISLDVRLNADPSIRLVIEDGVVVDYQFP